VTRFASALIKVAKINNLLGGGICGLYFCLAGAERCTILSFAEPTKQATIIKNNSTAHTPEFEEWKESAISNCTASLQVPTSIAVGSESGGVDLLYDKRKE
jgi:hypothetical protein